MLSGPSANYTQRRGVLNTMAVVARGGVLVFALAQCCAIIVAAVPAEAGFPGARYFANGDDNLMSGGEAASAETAGPVARAQGAVHWIRPGLWPSPIMGEGDMSVYVNAAHLARVIVCYGVVGWVLLPSAVALAEQCLRDVWVAYVVYVNRLISAAKTASEIAQSTTRTWDKEVAFGKAILRALSWNLRSMWLQGRMDCVELSAGALAYLLACGTLEHLTTGAKRTWCDLGVSASWFGVLRLYGSFLGGRTIARSAAAVALLHWYYTPVPLQKSLGAVAVVVVAMPSIVSLPTLYYCLAGAIVAVGFVLVWSAQALSWSFGLCAFALKLLISAAKFLTRPSKAIQQSNIWWLCRSAVSYGWIAACCVVFCAVDLAIMSVKSAYKLLAWLCTYLLSGMNHMFVFLGAAELAVAAFVRKQWSCCSNNLHQQHKQLRRIYRRTRGSPAAFITQTAQWLATGQTDTAGNKSNRHSGTCASKRGQAQHQHQVAGGAAAAFTHNSGTDPTDAAATVQLKPEQPRILDAVPARQWTCPGSEPSLSGANPAVSDDSDLSDLLSLALNSSNLAQKVHHQPSIIKGRPKPQQAPVPAMAREGALLGKVNAAKEAAGAADNALSSQRLLATANNSPSTKQARSKGSGPAATLATSSSPEVKCSASKQRPSSTPKKTGLSSTAASTSTVAPAPGLTSKHSGANSPVPGSAAASAIATSVQAATSAATVSASAGASASKTSGSGKLQDGNTATAAAAGTNKAATAKPAAIPVTGTAKTTGSERLQDGCVDPAIEAFRIKAAAATSTAVAATAAAASVTKTANSNKLQDSTVAAAMTKAATATSTAVAATTAAAVGPATPRAGAPGVSPVKPAAAAAVAVDPKTACSVERKTAKAKAAATTADMAADNSSADLADLAASKASEQLSEPGTAVSKKPTSNRDQPQPISRITAAYAAATDHLTAAGTHVDIPADVPCAAAETVAGVSSSSSCTLDIPIAIPVAIPVLPPSAAAEAAIATAINSLGSPAAVAMQPPQQPATTTSTTAAAGRISIHPPAAWKVSEAKQTAGQGLCSSFAAAKVGAQHISDALQATNVDPEPSAAVVDNSNMQTAEMSDWLQYCAAVDALSHAATQQHQQLVAAHSGGSPQASKPYRPLEFSRSLSILSAAETRDRSPTAAAGTPTGAAVGGSAGGFQMSCSPASCWGGSCTAAAASPVGHKEQGLQDRGSTASSMLAGFANDGPVFDDGVLCVVCRQEPRSHACVHASEEVCLCMCAECCDQHGHASRGCPLCKRPVEYTMQWWS